MEAPGPCLTGKVPRQAKTVICPPCPGRIFSMESLKEMLFEDPTAIYVVLALVWLVLALIWRRYPNRRTAAALAVPFVLAGGVFLLSRLVETDREQITRSVHEIAEAINEGRYADVGAYLEDGFGISGQRIADIPEAIDLLSRRAGQFRLGQVKVTHVDVVIEGRLADVQVQTMITRGDSRKVPVRWDLTWAEDSGRWRIRNLDRYQVKISLGL